MLQMFKKWEKKGPMPPPLLGAPAKLDWHRIGPRVKDLTSQGGHGPGSQFFFLDHVPGPFFYEVKPGQPEPRVDELAYYKQADSKIDWDKAFAHRDEVLKHDGTSKANPVKPYVSTPPTPI
jgi:hypothetical protein